MITIGLSGAQVTHLVHLLTAVAAHANDDDRYELHYSRSQLGQQMPAVEVLVLAGVLGEMTERPGLDAATREDCRRWSEDLNRLLSSPSATSWAGRRRSHARAGRRRPGGRVRGHQGDQPRVPL